MRKKLVDELREQGIKDEAVLAAMLEVPRHYFLDKAFEEKAYENRAFSIGQGQTISQPYTVARMTELLYVHKREKVLEVGTGSGYQAAVLNALGARVFSVERQKMLYENATALLQKLYLGRVRTYFRDGYKGLPEFAPFDGIIVTAGAARVPTVLLKQLKVGGRLIIPVSAQQEGGSLQELHAYTRIDENKYAHDKEGAYRFVPLLPGRVDGRDSKQR